MLVYKGCGIAALLLLLCACSIHSQQQGRAQATGLLLTLLHNSGGDAPLVCSFYVYESGRVEMKPVFGKAQHGTVTRGQLEEVKRLLGSPQYQDAWRRLDQAGTTTLRPDWEYVELKFDRHHFYVLPEDPAEGTLPLLKALDSLLAQSLGPHYADFRLMNKPAR